MLDQVHITDDAIRRAVSLLVYRHETHMALRIMRTGAPGEPERFDLLFDWLTLDGDLTRTVGGLRLVADETTAAHLAGATIDFVDTFETYGFVISPQNTSA